MLASIALWVEEAEILDALRPGQAAHLLASLRQAETSLRQLIERDEGRE
jgi:hypothetical protein